MGMTGSLIQSDLNRETITALWEVVTARVPNDLGHPNSVLGEHERVATQRYGFNSC